MHDVILKASVQLQTPWLRALNMKSGINRINNKKKLPRRTSSYSSTELLIQFHKRNQFWHPGYKLQTPQTPASFTFYSVLSILTFVSLDTNCIAGNHWSLLEGVQRKGILRQFIKHMFVYYIKRTTSYY